MTRRIVVPYKRKKEGKTNYHKRLSLLKSNKLRLVVRKSLKNVTVQLIEYKHGGDNVLVAANSMELIKHGWKGYRRNIPAAYLTGLLCAMKAKAKGIKEAILDSGVYVSTKGSVIYAALKGAADAGLNIPHGKELLPSEARLKGEHIKSENNFEQVKTKILGGSK